MHRPGRYQSRHRRANLCFPVSSMLDRRANLLHQGRAFQSASSASALAVSGIRRSAIVIENGQGYAAGKENASGDLSMFKALRAGRTLRAGASCLAMWAAASTSSHADERYAAMVFDSKSGQVLFSEAADEPRYPASLTKMMTLYVLFQELQANRLTLDSALPVSVYAAAQVPTKLGLQPGEAIRVEDAIKSLVAHSANDVAVAVAENLEGAEPAFAARMTRVARSLGMNSTYFQNASGLPNPEQLTTARDMIVLGAALRAHFPEYFGYFRTRTFAYRGRHYRTHNRLIGKVEGVDGIKTGYVRASGFNVVTSVRRGGRLLLAVVMGGQTAKARDQHMSMLLSTYLPDTASTPLPKARQESLSAAAEVATSPR